MHGMCMYIEVDSGDSNTKWLLKEEIVGYTLNRISLSTCKSLSFLQYKDVISNFKCLCQWQDTLL